MTFIEKLRRRWQDADTLLCVGLDPDPAKFPDRFVDDPDALFGFCRDIADRRPGSARTHHRAPRRHRPLGCT